MRYFVINDKRDRVVAIVCHDYMASHYICRSRSEAFTIAFYGVAKKSAYGKLVTKKDHVVINRIDPSYPMWMENVLKLVVGDYWRVSHRGEIEGELGVDGLVKRFFK